MADRFEVGSQMLQWISEKLVLHGITLVKWQSVVCSGEAVLRNVLFLHMKRLRSKVWSGLMKWYAIQKVSDCSFSDDCYYFDLSAVCR